MATPRISRNITVAVMLSGPVKEAVADGAPEHVPEGWIAACRRGEYGMQEKSRGNRVPGGQRQGEGRDDRVEHEGQLAGQTHDQLRLDRRLMNGDFKAFRVHTGLPPFRTRRRRRSRIEAEKRMWQRRRCTNQRRP